MWMILAVLSAVFAGAASECTLCRRAYLGVSQWPGKLGACLFPVRAVFLVSDGSLCETACCYIQCEGMAIPASNADRSFEKRGASFSAGAIF